MIEKNKVKNIKRFTYINLSMILIFNLKNINFLLFEFFKGYNRINKKLYLILIIFFKLIYFSKIIKIK